MSGCLTLPFRVLGCLGLLLLVAAGWLYRDQILQFVHEHTGAKTTPVEAMGRPSTAGVRRALDKVDSLNAWHADSVSLTAGEMASLIGAGLDPAFRGRIDSLQVKLETGHIGIEASLLTKSLPRDVLGPLGGMIGDREHLSADGSVAVVSPGRAEWTVDHLSLGSFPFPRELIPRLLERAMGSRSAAVPVQIPQGIRNVHITPAGVTLYRTAAHP
jgi:hypothetical protein